ncbi:type IV pilin protein [Aliamphritea hakodatensis]|uniref:type IV pilin protein n=1 Tax=Aliamphritea hakodatensis TaxID=2895352 RepID=UPI0022FD6848|nr:type IV pilin protein [Aliamphritea hakodatensis]
MRNWKLQRAFTLIELMIAVAIVGVLAGIAYPSYLEYVAAGRRADAQGNLIALAQHMERQFTLNGTYLTASGAVPVLPYVLSPQNGPVAFYALALPPGDLTANTFTIRARPANAMAGDRCGDMTIDNLGRKTPPECW